MTMTQRKKLSKSGWLLLGLFVVGVIVGITLHFVGIIDLSFIGNGYLTIMMWASSNGWNAAIVGAGHVVIGVLIFYGLKSYIIGEKISVSTPVGGYNPAPSYPSGAAQQQQETEIS